MDIATLVEKVPGDPERFADWVLAELERLGIGEGDDWSHLELWASKRSDEDEKTWHLSYR